MMAVNALEIAPAAIVTVPGTETFGLFEESVIAAPALPAGAFEATVHADDIPDTTDFGEHVSPVIHGLISVIDPVDPMAGIKTAEKDAAATLAS